MFYLVSCSQSSPKVNFPTGFMVFDYKDEESIPSVRFSVFVDVSSDEHRAASIKVESMSNGFEWESSSPLRFENEDRKYAGYTNFVMPMGMFFPGGRYKVTYTDASDESVETLLNISHNHDLYNMTAKDAALYMYSLSDCECLAVYKKNGVLIHYGQKRSGENMDYIWERYPNAIFAREVWVSPQNNVICLMPKMYKNMPK